MSGIPSTTRRTKGKGSVFYAAHNVHKYAARAPMVNGQLGELIGYFDSRWAAQRALDKWLAANEQKREAS